MMDVNGVLDGADPEPAAPTMASRWMFAVKQRFQHLLDITTPFVLLRWLFLAALAVVYGVRIYYVQGFYVVTYALGIFVLQLFIGFLTPQLDPQFDRARYSEDGGTLPTRGSDEFRPFVRTLHEFKFWFALVKAICLAFACTFFSGFDVPVFWPILFFYWLVLFISTMKRQIMHMVKYKYVPFTVGKQVYTGKRASSSDDDSATRS